MMPTGSARRYSPPSWLTAPIGSTPPAPSVTWPWLPTPKSVAAILTSTTRRSTRPNQEPVTPAQRHELDLTAGEPRGEMGQWIKQLAAGHRDFADRLADRQSQTIPSEDPDYGDLGLAFPPWTGPARDAILRPPKPEIAPSRRSSSA